MKNLITKWNWSKLLLWAAMIFWLLETAYFTFMYGWHYEAINEAERICDNIVTLLMTAGFLLTFVCVTDYIEFKLTIETKEDEKTIKKIDSEKNGNPGC